MGLFGRRVSAAEAQHLLVPQPRMVAAGSEELADGGVRLVGAVAIPLAAPSEQRSPQRQANRSGAAAIPGEGQAAGDSQGRTGLSLRERLRAILAPPLGALLPAEGSILEWAGDLLEYQIDGVRVLVSKPEVLLADDMGLGKTVQAIAALRILLHQGTIDSALVVAPASLVYQWRSELHKWAPELRVSTVTGNAQRRTEAWAHAAHVYVTTYESLRADMTPNPYCGPRRHTWGVAIVDEAQRIKNRETGASAACKSLPRLRSWALTGTPLENSIDDLASIMEFLQPNQIGAIVPALAVDVALMERHRELQLRRRKSDVLTQLPPKRLHNVILDLTPEQRRAYDRAEGEGVIELRARGETVTITHVLSLITRLKQLCNFCPTAGDSAKLNDLRERIAILCAEDHRALVFTQFTDENFGVGAVARGLSEYRPLTYTGAMTQEARQSTLTRFKSEPDRGVLVLSLRAGGQGLNLQEASYVVHFDRWWNPASERQAEDRSHRMGQTQPVDVYTYTCSGTIEERIAKLLEDKQQLFDTVIDQVTMDLDRVLSADELFGLFDLRPPQRQRADAARRTPSGFADMTGREFEEFVEQLFRALGYETELTQESRDGGVDVIARQEDIVGVTTTLYIQCKNHAAPVGVEVVRAAAGIVPLDRPNGRAVVVCPAGFSADATRFAPHRGVQLIDGERLEELRRRAGGASE
jgi:HJR/Mrr/RecB family endonuclease